MDGNIEAFLLLKGYQDMVYCLVQTHFRGAQQQ